MSKRREKPARKVQYEHTAVTKEISDIAGEIAEQGILGYRSKQEFFIEWSRIGIMVLRFLNFIKTTTPKILISGYAEPKPEKHSSGIKNLTLLAFIFISLFGIAVFSRGNITAGLIDPLSPFRVNIPELYQQYSYLIDFLVFSAIFVSIAHITIGKRFGHKGITIAIGTALAIALSAMEPVWGFNLKNLGPFAASIFLLVLGYFVYGLIRRFDIDRIGAVACAIVFIYLGMTFYTPSFILWFVERLPILSLIVLAVFAFVVYKIGQRLLTKKEAFISAEPEVLSSAEVREYYPKIKEQEQIIKKYLSKIVKKASKQSKQIIAEIAYISDIIDKFGSSPEGKRLIVQKIRDISPQDHALQEMLHYLKATTQQVRNFDLRLFQQFKEKYIRLSPMEQRKVRDEVQDELEKINAENKLSEFESEWETYNDTFSRYLESATISLNEGNIDEAKKHLKAAMGYEMKTIDILDQMKDFEDLLYALTKKELKNLKRK